jgi:hypothetical protein
MMKRTGILLFLSTLLTFNSFAQEKRLFSETSGLGQNDLNLSLPVIKPGVEIPVIELILAD